MLHLWVDMLRIHIKLLPVIFLRKMPVYNPAAWQNIACRISTSFIQYSEQNANPVKPVRWLNKDMRPPLNKSRPSHIQQVKA